MEDYNIERIGFAVPIVRRQCIRSNKHSFFSSSYSIQLTNPFIYKDLNQEQYQAQTIASKSLTNSYSNIPST